MPDPEIRRHAKTMNFADPMASSTPLFRKPQAMKHYSYLNQKAEKGWLLHEVHRHQLTERLEADLTKLQELKLLSDQTLLEKAIEVTPALEGFPLDRVVELREVLDNRAKHLRERLRRVRRAQYQKET